MISFWRIFCLEFVALVRSKSLALLLAASAVWMFVAPAVFRGDGTASGARELAVHYSLGGVAALVATALLMSAAGSISGERVSRRLALALVRPVPRFTLAFGRMAALVAAGALVLGVAALVEAARNDLSRPSRHVLRPLLPSPREEAEIIYESYMRDPTTPEAVRKAGRSAVIRLLAQRALDNYLTMPTNTVSDFEFPRIAEGASVRLRFTNSYGMRDDVRGTIEAAGMTGAVSNLTQSVIEVPLVGAPTASAGPVKVSLRNTGSAGVMLRPRRDLEVLLPADGFGVNLLRAWLELVAMLALLVSFGVFLGAGLGRPTAVFTAIVTLLVSEMSPSVLEQYPAELAMDRADEIGLYLTRFAAEVTNPLSSLRPLEALSADECVEWREVLRTLAFDGLLLPLLFALLSAAVLPRKLEQQGG